MLLCWLFSPQNRPPISPRKKTPPDFKKRPELPISKYCMLTVTLHYYVHFLRVFSFRRLWDRNRGCWCKISTVHDSVCVMPNPLAETWESNSGSQSMYATGLPTQPGSLGVSCGFIFDGSFKFKINFQTWTRTAWHRKRWISWVHTRNQQLESGWEMHCPVIRLARWRRTFCDL